MPAGFAPASKVLAVIVRKVVAAPTHKSEGPGYNRFAVETMGVLPHPHGTASRKIGKRGLTNLRMLLAPDDPVAFGLAARGRPVNDGAITKVDSVVRISNHRRDDVITTCHADSSHECLPSTSGAGDCSGFFFPLRHYQADLCDSKTDGWQKRCSGWQAGFVECSPIFDTDEGTDSRMLLPLPVCAKWLQS
jgi:hypothetical protein